MLSKEARRKLAPLIIPLLIELVISLLRRGIIALKNLSRRMTGTIKKA